MVRLFFQWGGKVWWWSLFNRSHTHCLAAASSNQNLCFPVQVPLWGRPHNGAQIVCTGSQETSPSPFHSYSLCSWDPIYFSSPQFFHVFQMHSKVTYGSKLLLMFHFVHKIYGISYTLCESVRVQIGKIPTRQGLRELTKGLCSEVKASCVETPRGGTVAPPGPEGAGGSNNDAGALEIWPWAEGSQGLSYGIKEKQLLSEWCEPLERAGEDIHWPLSPPSLSSPAGASMNQTQPEFRRKGSRWRSPSIHWAPQGTEGVRESQRVDRGGQKTMTGPVAHSKVRIMWLSYM